MKELLGGEPGGEEEGFNGDFERWVGFRGSEPVRRIRVDSRLSSQSEETVGGERGREKVGFR